MRPIPLPLLRPEHLSAAQTQNRNGRLANRDAFGRWKNGRCVKHGSIEVRRILSHIHKLERLKAERGRRSR